MSKDDFDTCRSNEFCKQAKIPFTVKRDGVDHVYCVGEIMSPSDFNMRKGRIYASEDITPHKILSDSIDEIYCLQKNVEDSRFSEDYDHYGFHNFNGEETRDSVHRSDDWNLGVFSKEEEEDEMFHSNKNERIGISNVRSFGLEIQPPCPQCKNDLILEDSEHRTPPFCPTCQTYFVRSSDRDLLSSWVDMISSIDEEMPSKGKIVFIQDIQDPEDPFPKDSCPNHSLFCGNFDNLFHSTLDHFASRAFHVLDSQETISARINPEDFEVSSALELSDELHEPTLHSKSKGGSVMFDDKHCHDIQAVSTNDEEDIILNDIYKLRNIASDAILTKASMNYSLSSKICDSCGMHMMKNDGELTCVTCISITQHAKAKAKLNRERLRNSVLPNNRPKEQNKNKSIEERYTQQIDAYLAMSSSFSIVHDKENYEGDICKFNDSSSHQYSIPHDVTPDLFSASFNIHAPVSNLSFEEHSLDESTNIILKDGAVNRRVTRPKPEDPPKLRSDLVSSENVKKRIESASADENKENTVNSSTGLKSNAISHEIPNYDSTESNMAFNNLIQRLEYISQQMDGIDLEIEAIERRQTSDEVGNV